MQIKKTGLVNIYEGYRKISRPDKENKNIWENIPIFRNISNFNSMHILKWLQLLPEEVCIYQLFLLIDYETN